MEAWDPSEKSQGEGTAMTAASTRGAANEFARTAAPHRRGVQPPSLRVRSSRRSLAARPSSAVQSINARTGGVFREAPFGSSLERHPGEPVVACDGDDTAM